MTAPNSTNPGPKMVRDCFALKLAQHDLVALALLSKSASAEGRETKLLLDESVGEQLGLLGEIKGPLEIAVGRGFARLQQVRLDLALHGFLFIAELTR